MAGGFENLLGTLDTVYLTGDTSKKVGLYTLMWMMQHIFLDTLFWFQITDTNGVLMDCGPYKVLSNKLSWLKEIQNL